MQLHQNVKNNVESNEPMQVKMFANRNTIQVNRHKTKVILQWTHDVKKMIRNAQDLPQNDMHRYFGSSEM